MRYLPFLSVKREQIRSYPLNAIFLQLDMLTFQVQQGL